MAVLKDLINYGQSYWIDNLSREMISSGSLEHRVKEEGLRGMTSNPTIFNKAISKSNDYDAQIKALVGSGNSTSEIYEALVIKDVQNACDIFQPVYQQSNGLDGFVSLEVSPYLARHTQATMEEARKLFAAVNRPNLYIKIPGTIEGLPAIEQMLVEGINVNITLLFSVDRYEDVAKIYIHALEKRDKNGDDIHMVSSVASFFLSRIDVLVDKLLLHRILPNDPGTKAESLLGKIAVANAKLAYQSFKDIFQGRSWEKLVDKGARVQRPLWASTSTKNPEYRDVMYVEPLIGHNTVNTMPEETISAFADHGQINENVIEEGLEEARRDMKLLGSLGIDLRHVTQQLEDEGIQKFIDPFTELITNLIEKSEKFSTKVPSN